MVSFSVIIPTKNRPQFLAQAVASVLAQDYPVSDVIVVDDGHGAAETLASLPASVQVLDNQGRGPVAARRLGVATASADCIAFLDDDDYWTAGDFLRRAADAMTAGAGLCFGDGAMVFDDGRVPQPFGFDATAWTLERDNTILISSVVYRRSLHASLGEFDEALPYYWD